MKLQKMTTQDDQFSEVCSKWVNHLTKEELALATTMAQLIWLRWNEVVHGKNFTHPQLLVQKEKENQKAL